MRHILTIIFLAFGLTHSFGQSSLSSKWYTFSFDPVKVIEFNFNDTIFSNNKFDWDLKSLPGTETTKVLKIVRKHDTYYYLMQDESIAPKVMVNIFYILKYDTSFSQPSMSDENTFQNDLKSALAFVASDTLQRPGMTFYSQKEFQRIKSLPNANTITKADYKKYLLGIIESRNEFESYAKKHKDDFGFMFYFTFLNNQTRTILANIGYNPLIADKEIEQVGDKFKNDNEINELRERALKFE